MKRAATMILRKPDPSMMAALARAQSKPQQYRRLDPLFPFSLRKCCSCVARVVVVEQRPARSLCYGGLLDRSRDGIAARHCCADIRGHRFEIAAFVCERGGPSAHWTMTGNHALRRQSGELVDGRQEAPEAAVKHGHMVKKNEVAAEQGSRLLVED